MRARPPEIQFGAATFEPDGLQSLFFLNPEETWTIAIPIQDPLRHWASNQYNFPIDIRPVVDDPRGKLPSCRLQIAIYRQRVPINPLPTGNYPIAQMVASTYYDSGTISFPTLLSGYTFDFDDTIILGASYWLVIRMSNLAAGINYYQFGYSGWSLADSYLYGNIWQDAVSTGTLPATYLSTNIAVPTNYPYIKPDYV